MWSLELQQLFELLAPWWVELSFIISFPIGFWFLQLEAFGRKPQKDKGKLLAQRSPAAAVAADARALKLQGDMEEACRRDDGARALALWRASEASVASTPEALKLATRLLASESPATVAEELGRHMERHRAQLCDTRGALAVLDAVGHGRQPELLDKLSGLCRDRLGIPVTYQWYEALLGGHAFSGDGRRVAEVIQEIADAGQKLTARAHALVIKGYLTNGMLDDGLKQAFAMLGQGFYVPPFAVALLFKVAGDHNRLNEVLETCLAEGMALPDEAVALVFDDCLRRQDAALAATVEEAIRRQHAGRLPAAAYDPLLKVLVIAGDRRAFDLWRELGDQGVRLSEGFYAGAVSRCADARFLDFAAEVHRHCKAAGKMSVPLYGALIKVYAHCGLNDKACECLPEMTALGLAPDAPLCSRLLRAALDAGREDLAEQISRQSPDHELQSAMAAIRAAGRDRDLDRAFEVMQTLLQRGGGKADVVVFNCVLDACVTAGDMPRARALFEDMKARFGRLDPISYNTLVKGVTASGDVPGAYKLMREMLSEGVKPNDIFFNCIVNAAASAGDFEQAWSAIDAMQAQGLKADHYTMSIMLKALKRHGGPRDVRRIFTLVEQSGLDVCTEEVLLNTLLEVSMHLNDTQRLRGLLAAQRRSRARPSLHLYGGLIKANGLLRQLGTCRELWQQMVQDGGTPNEVVLGCMLDALVCNHEVDEAVALFRRWRGSVSVNMVLFSTLIKGFAAGGKVDEAMEMYRDIKASGVEINTVVYNTLIDTQARRGNTAEVEALFASMRADGVRPDSITYSTMVKSHCVKGDLEQAVCLLEEMQALGLVKDCVVFNTVLDWCTKHNRMDVADRVLADFKRLGIQPTNFTVSVLVKLYGRRRMLDKAFEVVAELPGQWGFAPNAQVRTCLMSACFLNHNPSRAMEVFRQLPDREADAKSFGVVISGLTRAGKVQEAAELVEEAYGLGGRRRGLAPHEALETETLELLFRVLGQRRLADKVGRPLLAALGAAGARVRSGVLQAALEGGTEPPSRRPGRGAGAMGRR